ncbi:MAG: hypothetical protein ACR2MZ_07960 [Candidatus Dormibacter sp.]|uniref:hypothetical protein n=1 Tax=Candidatus Dormibacter sp. TaxID=2973982 RepID=UPI000DB0D7F7|nr:MAG: hypothetical protein DLM66_10470 [Candidatus Dormibacteraeota bacterium]
MNRIIIALLVLVGVLVGFYAGGRYGQVHPPASSAVAAQAAAATTGGGGTASTAGTAGSGGGARPISGPIVAVDSTSITVHDRTTNKDVKITLGSARITKTTPGDQTDLKKDTTVSVVGQAGPDGVVAAQVVSVGGGGGFGGGRGPSPSP